MIRKLAVFTLIVISLAMKVEASQIPVTQVKDKIVKHSVEIGVDPAIALSLAKAESGFRHEAKSPYGAVGVFQLMPATAKKLGVNPYHIDGNIRGGLMYYKMLYKMFGSNELALAAYHTGPAYVLKYKQPAPCSKKYVSAIMRDYYWLKAHTDPAVLRHNAQMKTKQQADQKAKEQAELKAKQQAELKAKQTAELQAKQQAELLAAKKAEISVVPPNTSEITSKENQTLKNKSRKKAHAKKEVKKHAAYNDSKNGSV